MNAFLTFKERQVAEGELSQRTFIDYYKTCIRLTDHFGKQISIETLTSADFGRYRDTFPKWSLTVVTRSGRRYNFVASFFARDHSFTMVQRSGFMSPLWYWLERDQQNRNVEKGPVSFEDLVEMIRNRTLNEQDLVHSGDGQDWQRTDTVPELFAMAERTPVASQESPLEVTVPPAETSGPRDNAAKGVNRRITKLMAILILIGMIGIFWWNVSPMFVTQQQVLSSLQEAIAELRNLRAAEVDDETWDQFRQRTLTKLSSYVPKLEQDADVSDPASLSLLGVSRDYLPQLLTQESRFSEELDSKISRHLAVAQQVISQGTTTGVPTEFWMLVLVSLNTGLVIGAIWIIAKKMLFRAMPAHVATDSRPA